MEATKELKTDIPVAVLTRVSTNRQETDRQETELLWQAMVNRWRVVEVIREKISGAVEEEKREGLCRLRALVESGQVRKVMVHEISRLSRRPSVLHKLVEDFTEKGVSIYWHSQRIETLLDDGRRNPAAGLMMAIMGEMARAELEVLRERIRSGIAEAKRKGVHCGRPKGSLIDRIRTYPKIVAGLERGLSLREVAAIEGVSVSTVKRVAGELKQV